jgi:hypothetical protein
MTFPSDVLADLLDGANEISVWEIGDDANGPEVDHLVAALHSQGAQNLSDMTLRVISDWKIKTDLHLNMRKTRGDSVDSELNKANKHWVIDVATVGDAIKLAKAFKEREELPFSRDNVMRRFAVSIQQKRISTERISAGLWKKLIDDGYLSVAADQPAAAGAGDGATGAVAEATPAPETPPQGV